MRGQTGSISLAATLAVYQCRFVPVPEGITVDVSSLISESGQNQNAFHLNMTVSPFSNSNVTILSFTSCTRPLIFISLFQDKALFFQENHFYSLILDSRQHTQANFKLWLQTFIPPSHASIRLTREEMSLIPSFHTYFS